MAPESGPVRWNPQSQQWEQWEEAEPEGREGPEPGSEGPPHPSGPQPPPKPAYLPDAVPPVQRTARRWWPRAAVAGGLVVVLGGAALAAVFVLREPPGLPAGYKVLRSAGSGFQVAVPDDWELSTSESGTGAGTVFRPAQGRGSLLQVFPVTGGPDDPCEVLHEGTRELSTRDGYRRLFLDPKDGRGCELVYEVPDPDGNGTARGIGRLTVASDGSRWVLMTFGPADRAKAVRAHMAAALGSFRPG
ncbi:hypothetical protein [Streptomyces sp. NBC_01443]|uniref:hypothetical protein n=1 Tax=Streptomyces sp. NBC_01443 TaxID=2903868 RepID=UPI002253A119|nr:hypothetical protein [Streptomyces sp. NBC_01443]MCX4628034.1 hypothetical protein [Streptomyces sp. NBC_01443]